jgi:hypothetical protein
VEGGNPLRPRFFRHDGNINKIGIRRLEQFNPERNEVDEKKEAVWN